MVLSMGAVHIIGQEMGKNHFYIHNIDKYE